MITFQKREKGEGSHDAGGIKGLGPAYIATELQVTGDAFQVEADGG